MAGKRIVALTILSFLCCEAFGQWTRSGRDLEDSALPAHTNDTSEGNPKETQAKEDSWNDWFCYEKDVTYEGQVIGVHQNTTTPEECHMICKSNEECQYFMFFAAPSTSNIVCELRSSQSGAAVVKEGVVSGPKHCWNEKESFDAALSVISDLVSSWFTSMWDSVWISDTVDPDAANPTKDGSSDPTAVAHEIVIIASGPLNGKLADFVFEEAEVDLGEDGDVVRVKMATDAVSVPEPDDEVGEITKAPEADDEVAEVTKAPEPDDEISEVTEMTPDTKPVLSFALI